MIRPGALAMTVVMVGVAAGVYFGLDYVPRDAIPGFLQNPPAVPDTPTAAPPVLPPAETAAPAVTDPEGAPGDADTATPTETADVAAAEADTPAPEPEPTETAAAESPSEPAPQPASPQPAPVQATAPAPAPRKSAPPAKPRPAASVASAEPASPPRPIGNKAPQADVIKQWWPDPSSMPANQLKLVYAGQVQGEQVIALLFSAPLKPETVKGNIQLRTIAGDPVPGEWEIGKTPRMALFRGVPPGRYTVILAPRIEDTNGFILGTVLRGPVYVKGS